ncbi:MAG TPA: YncE family protein [Candidatus Angelobacter sp.]
MQVVRMLRVVVIFMVAIFEIGCGDTFRPIAIPQNPQPPDPKNEHFALVLSANGPEACPLPGAPTAPCDPSIHPGGSSRIDVSGDTNVGTATVGLNPVHAVLLPPPSNDTAYVANLSDNTITSYLSLVAGAATTTITLPPGTNPVFLETKEAGIIYAAGVGNGSTGQTVSVISTGQNVITRTLTASDGIGRNPIAMVETSNGKKLYVVNNGDGTVSAINTIDKTLSAVIPTGTRPIWAVARADDGRVFVLNQGNGTVSVIDAVNDVVLANITVDPTDSVNYMAYDASFSRLYLTIPATSQVAVLDVTSDPPVALPNIDLSTVCPVGTCKLGAVTTLPAGTNNSDSRKGTIYVSSYTISGTCTQLAGAPTDNPPCITTQVSVIKPVGNVVQKTITTLHTVFVNSVSVGTKADVPVVPFCDLARFRRHIAASADDTRVFVANCDAGGTDIIRTSDDSFVLNLPAPVSSAPALPNQAFPPPQNPVFVLAGR